MKNKQQVATPDLPAYAKYTVSSSEWRIDQSAPSDSTSLQKRFICKGKTNTMQARLTMKNPTDQMIDININNYLQNIARYFRDETSSEMSYRTDFQCFLETIFPKTENYHIQHDPKATSGNKPDFIIAKNSVPLLYIEVKKVGEDLDKIEKSNQANRYFGYTNLIISDYLEFRFYRNGQKYDESISLGKPNQKTKEIAFQAESGERLTRTILDFTASQKEPIKSGKHLAKIMGGKAQRIRDNIVHFLNLEKSENVELIKIMNVIRENLVADIDTEKFADMYAQTLVYGLFVARYSDKTLDDFSRQEARELVPPTNPFLQHFFDHIAGSSFPKRLDILVSELCEVFTHANVHHLMKDYFSRKNLFGEIEETADPVIHFYEDFLREYDPTKKMEMGVFYTPRPVVRFIIRSVDTILKKEFGIVKGLADSQKIVHEMQIINHKGKKEKIKKDLHKVQILDFATGTGTFLNETVEYIHETFKSREGVWASYAENDLIPRLFGFELMMASYTIAHLKLAITFGHTGIKEIKNRLGIYLTNTLDEAKDFTDQMSFFGFLDSIADESKSASRIKKEYPIMAIIGNPPYSGISQNKHYTENNVYKVEPGGKQKLQERKQWLDDDYVKFIRFAESLVEKNGEGIIGMITAHGYIDNPTFRGMRWHLRNTFDAIYVLDLHGNSNKKETAPDGSKDENVFDIKTGVAILIGVKKKSSLDKGGLEDSKKLATVYHADFFGLRKVKFADLNKNDVTSIKWVKLPEDSDVWKLEGKGKSEYIKGFSVNDLFPKNNVGIVSACDGLNISFSKNEHESKIQDILNLDELSWRNKYNRPKDAQAWKYEWAKKDALENQDKNIVEVSYRPFDTRYTLYTGKSGGLYARPIKDIMQHYLLGKNIGLLLTKGVRDPLYNHVFITENISEAIFLSGTTATNAMNFPLYLYYEHGEREANLDKEIWQKINKTTGKTQPEDILDYVYAYLHNPKYREKYKEFLKTDFPRVPFPDNTDEFWRLVKLGNKLRGLHLLTDSVVKNPITTFPIAGTNEVGKIKYENGNVFINDMQYFGNVPQEAWNFYIGGYQPAQKFLKDRKGNILYNSDIERYEEIIVSLSETEKVMREINEKEISN